MISIVVPVYNAEKYLDRSIGSVISQTNSDWELILVNDGSLDNSGEICEKYSSKYENIKVLHKKNEGQLIARQLGIDNSSGDYIGFLDADDELDKNYVEDLSCFINEHDNPSIVCFGFTEILSKEIKKSNILREYVTCDTQGKEKIFNHILDGTFSGSMWNKVFSSSLIKLAKVDFELVKDKRYGEDTFHFYSLLQHAYSVAFLDKHLYNYYRNEDGASLGFEHRDFSYFNTRYVYELLVQIIKMWCIETVDSTNRLQASNFNDSIYYVLKYLRSATSIKRKIECINYDWSKYLIDNNLAAINNNPYIRKSYVKVYKAFLKKRYLYILLREKIGW